MDRVHTAPRVWNSGWSNSLMDIYSLIIVLTIVGGDTAPLLRVIPVDRTRERPSSLFAELRHAHYTSLHTTRCNFICILIYNKACEK